MENVIVTTGHAAAAGHIALAEQVARQLVCAYVPRMKLSLPALRHQYGVQYVIVAAQGRLTLHTPEGELFFHPSMAHLRVKNLRLGMKDHLVEAMGLQAGMQVLDCTLGFGADAIVASFAVGETGTVTGLESSPLVAAVIGHGLGQVIAENYPIQEAMRRIRVVAQDHLSYLRQQPDKSVDIVYFDPMFRHPLETSASMEPLRLVANHDRVSTAAIAEARRVARCRVVLKENSRSQEFSRLGFTRLAGGKYSHVRYGIMDL